MTLRSGKDFQVRNGQLLKNNKNLKRRKKYQNTNINTKKSKQSNPKSITKPPIQTQKIVPKQIPIQQKPIPTVPNLTVNQKTNQQPINHPNQKQTATEENPVSRKISELFKDKKYITSYSKYLKQVFDKLEVPSKYRRRLRKFPRRKTKVHGPFNTYQMDLIEYRNLKHHNNGYSYILSIIDCFSRFGFAYPLKSKDADSTAEQILVFLESLQTVPRFIYSDAGKEFENSKVQDIFKSRGILHFVLKQGPKASIVERFNKTIKTSMEMYFSENNTKRWFGEPLEFIVDNYNNRISRSIGMAPVDVNLGNYMKVYKKLYPKYEMKKLCKLKKGDIVRIALKSDLFKKGYKQQYSDELYTISKSILSGNVCYYIIKNKSGETFKKYYQELSLVGHVNNNDSVRNK